MGRPGMLLVAAMALIVTCADQVSGSLATVSATRAAPGDTAVLITLSLNNIVPYAGAELSLQYDPGLLDLNRIEPGPRLSGQSGAGYYEYANGKTALLFFDFDGASLPADSGVIFNGYFDVSPDVSEGEARISLLEMTAISDDLQFDPVTVSNGTIFIREYLCGDVDNNGGVDESDITALLGYLFQEDPEPTHMKASDANKDGDVDMADVCHTINYLFRGGPHPCPDEPWLAVCLTDILGKVLIEIDAAGDSANVLISGRSPADVYGYQFSLSWNDGKLELARIEQTAKTESLGLYHNAGAGGQLMLGMVDVTGEKYVGAGLAPLFMITLKPKTQPFVLGSLRLRQAIFVDGMASKLRVLSAADRRLVGGQLLSDLPLPKVFSLSQNEPNPFVGGALIRYALPCPCAVEITVYNVIGQRVRTLVDGREDPGYRHVVWDGRNEAGEDVGAGVYFCKMNAGDATFTKKMVLLE